MLTPVISRLRQYIQAQPDTLVEVHKWYCNVHVTVRRHKSPVGHDELMWLIDHDLLESHSRVVSRRSKHNIITDVGKNMARDLLRDTIADGKIRYVAIGTSSTAVNGNQTQLVTETFRKAVTKFTAGTVGRLTTTVYIAPAESNVSINELGWFAGPSAGAGVNTGIMTSRVLYAHTKTNLESLQIDREDVFA